MIELHISSRIDSNLWVFQSFAVHFMLGYFGKFIDESLHSNTLRYELTQRLLERDMTSQMK